MFHRWKDETDIEEDENIEGTSKKSPNKNSPVKSKFGGDPLLRKVFEKHYGSPKKTSSKKLGKENRDEPGPSKQRDSENFTDSFSTFDNAPMLKRPKQSKNFQTSKNLTQSNDNDGSERDMEVCNDQPCYDWTVKEWFYFERKWQLFSYLE